MHLTDLSIDGFGVLSSVSFEELEPGLNVIHGPNGSGKTTVLHFLRGVLCGFDDARRRRLLPPLSGGRPGGSIDVTSGDRRYRITRQALANETDRLAVTVRRGSVDDSSGIRGILEALSPELVHLQYAVVAGDAHALDRLLQLALADGVALQGARRPSARFDERLAEARQRRIALLGGNDAAGETERLRTACAQAQAELVTHRQAAEQLRETLAVRFEEVACEIERMAGRVAFLDLEIQAVQTDLSEADREPPQPAPLIRTRPVTLCEPGDDVDSRLARLDQRIARVQAVLEDLAEEGLHLRVLETRTCGQGADQHKEALLDQRRVLQELEGAVLGLRNAAHAVASQNQQSCCCEAYDDLIRDAAATLQQQVYNLCRQIGRHEAAIHHAALVSRKERLDRCEADLRQHLVQLHRDREELRFAHNAAELAFLRNPTAVETAACQCREHDSFRCNRSTSAGMAVASGRADGSGGADLRRLEARLVSLREEHELAKSEWRQALALRDEWETEHARLIVLERRIAEQQVAIEDRERCLNDRLVEGQSLLLVEAGLEQMRASVFEEQPAPVIAAASRLLAKLTGGRYAGLQVSKALELSAVSDSGVAVAVHNLSRGMLDQAALSLRLALADEYARRGVTLPLVYDEVLADSDPDRVDVAIRLLQEAATRHQIVYFTCQEHLAARFEAAGVSVRDFPGTRRNRHTAPASPPAAVFPQVDRQELDEPTEDHSLHAAITNDAHAAVQDSQPGPTRDLHPGDAHWLRVSSSAALVPSVGEQMARRLASAGVRCIGDLVVIDPEQTDLPLESLQITPAQWRIWQAEARLLTCVPRLNGRDAQLLAAVGILLPQELAEADPDQLVRKIDRLRGDGRSGWVLQGFVWPDRNTVAEWIANGRRARTFREACEAIGWRREEHAPGDRRGPDGRDRRRFRIDQPSPHRGPRFRRGAAIAGRGRAKVLQGRFRENAEARSQFAASAPLPAQPLAEPPHGIEPVAESPVRLRFHLEPQSPILEAPSVGPTTARRLEGIGVLTIADLLSRDAQQLAERLQHRRVNAEAIRQWQDQARLVCRIPELRGHDAQVLVACGLRDPESIARLSPQALFAIVGPFVATREGQRLLRSAKCPDLAEVTDWITWAQQARVLKAA